MCTIGVCPFFDCEVERLPVLLTVPLKDFRFFKISVGSVSLLVAILTLRCSSADWQQPFQFSARYCMHEMYVFYVLCDYHAISFDRQRRALSQFSMPHKTYRQPKVLFVQQALFAHLDIIRHCLFSSDSMM